MWTEEVLKGVKMKEKCVTLLSGGMDSATLMYSLLEKYDVYPITIVYGQRHQKEATAARNLCEAVSKEMVQRWKYVDLGVLRTLLPSTLTGSGDIPEGLYDAPSMSQTVVPGRNLILLAIAGGYASGIGAKFLAYGPHSGDHFIYRDCRPEFIEAARLALERGYGVELIAPFSEMDKGDIAILGRKLNVPYKLSWTCYVGQERPCGKCGACTERTSAFLKADMQDPALTTEEWKKAVEYLNSVK
jgi:7-cyano-7-deazaguanine synthase